MTLEAIADWGTPNSEWDKTPPAIVRTTFCKIKSGTNFRKNVPLPRRCEEEGLLSYSQFLSPVSLSPLELLDSW